MRKTVTVSEEKGFIYHSSFNKGHVQIPNMVNKCIGLSSDAKIFYSNILCHVYEKGQTVFPSIYRLAVAGNCTLNSAVNYVNELVDKGFVIKEQRGLGMNNVYHIKECHEVPLLHVSEMVWEVLSDLSHQYGWKKVIQAKDKFLKYLSSNAYRLQDVTADSESKEKLKVLLEHILKGGNVELSLLPKIINVQRKNVKRIESAPPQPPVVESIEEPELKSKPKKRPNKAVAGVGVDSRHWKVLNVSEWTSRQFKEYYYDKYLDTVGHPHPSNHVKHMGIINRVLKNLNNDKELLKRYIDAVFEIGYENLSIESFSSATRLGEIQTYLVNGTKPFYIKKKQQSFDNVEDVVVDVHQGLSQREKLNKLLGGD